MLPGLRASTLALAASLALGGCCSSCGCGAAGPRAGGETPYVRCAVVDPPEPRAIPAGRGTLSVDAEGVRLEGATPPVRLVALRGPAPSGASFENALGPVEELAPDLVVVFGGLGETPEDVTATVSGLARLELPVLVLLGGRDVRADLSGALAATSGAERVVDLSGVRRVSLGGLDMIPVPGAPEGRYARSDDACGLGAEDADAIAAALGGASETPRVLLSWAAPAPATGIEGGDAGSALVAALAERVGSRGGLYAYPETLAGLEPPAEGPFRFVVPPSVGAPLTRADGSLSGVGPTLLTISDGVLARSP